MPDMQYRRLGRSGLKVSVLSFGSWVTFGNADQLKTAQQAAECLSVAKDAGVNFFDNAEAYSAGESERVMGAAFRELGWKRHEYIGLDQCSGAYDVGPTCATRSIASTFSQAIDGSLERFGLDFVDLVCLSPGRPQPRPLRRPSGP